MVGLGYTAFMVSSLLFLIEHTLESLLQVHSAFLAVPLSHLLPRTHTVHVTTYWVSLTESISHLLPIEHISIHNQVPCIEIGFLSIIPSSIKSSY